MKLSKKLENLFSATAFAEEGEFDTAIQMVEENSSDQGRKPVAGEVKLEAPRLSQSHLAPKA